MKFLRRKSLIAIALFGSILPAGKVIAGNPDRVGQAGATELLINPWSRSSGWSGANSGSINGIEAQFYNVAGIAQNRKTEAVFSHTNYLQGTGMGINAFGLAVKSGESGVLGFSLMSLSFGDVQITTTELPEGGLGNYKPQYINIGFSYAKMFSNSIFGGVTLKIIDESISNVSAGGIAIDAGIQYVTGTNEDRNNVKFGIALKNVGTPLKFGGDGLSTRVNAPATNNVYQLTIEQKASGFEIPSLINIGATYDFNIAADHTLSAAVTFTSNSFTNDQFIGGLEYRFLNKFMIRGGFIYEKDLFDDNLRTTVYSGPSAGVTLDLPLGKSGKSFGIDYSYRASDPWDGIHSFGVRFAL